jgi:hypothetical protein
MIEHLKNIILNQPLNRYIDKRYIENYCMLRYDEAIYTKKKNLDDRF